MHVVAVVVARCVGGEVGVVGLPAAGHRDVEVLAVHPGPYEHDPDVGGGALGGVDGGGPAVLAVLRELVGRQDRAAPPGEVLNNQALPVPACLGFAVSGSGAEDPEPVPVADM